MARKRRRGGKTKKRAVRKAIAALASRRGLRVKRLSLVKKKR